MRYRETSLGKTSFLFRSNGCGPGTELLTRFKPSTGPRYAGPSSYQRVSPHRIIEMSHLPGAFQQDKRKLPGLDSHIASGRTSL